MIEAAQDIRWGELFALQLPPTWSWSDENDAITVFRPDGVGVLHVSILARENTESSRSHAARSLGESFVRQRHWDLPSTEIRVVNLSDSSLSEFEFTEHGDRPTYWQVWHIVGQRRAAFITYTCEPNDVEIEAEDRQKIVDSFRWL